MRIAAPALAVLLLMTGPSLAQRSFVGPQSPRCVTAPTGRFVCVKWQGPTCTRTAPEKKTRCW